MPSGIIIKGIGGFYYVKTQEGIYECKARGIFRKGELVPLPGDRVSISVLDDIKKLGNIDEIQPRVSQLIRPAVANITQVAAVVAVKSPTPDFALLDKLLITSRLKNIQTIICINKMDLDEKEEHKKILESYRGTGCKVILISSKADMGFDLLAEAMKGRITVFAGQSGVGKSTILNHVMDSFIMETGEVSSKIERGKHTTRHAELFELEMGGYVVDTPGFSSFELTDIKYDELELYYPEFEPCLNQCRFTGCSHISEPGCRVKEAVEKGDIGPSRYERYIEFYQVLKQQDNNKYRKNKGY